MVTGMNNKQQEKLGQLKQQIAGLLTQIAEIANMQEQHEKDIDAILTAIENALQGK